MGTLQLLPPEEAARVRGLVINRFRGDLAILEPGLRFLEEKTGRPVLGVVPYLQDLGVAPEDSVSLGAGFLRPDAALDIAVVRFPRIANFDDFAPLLLEPDVSLRFVHHPFLLGTPDLLILPGTKNTVADLQWLFQSGWAEVICRRAASGMPVLGVCGGYQMLGKEISDPEGLEDEAGTFPGLGLLDAATVFRPEKVTVRRRGVAAGFGMLAGLKGEGVEGYEIHAGETFRGAKAEPVFLLGQDGGEVPEGAVQGTVWGTYLHGLFEADGFRRGVLNLLRQRRGLQSIDSGVCFAFQKEASFDRLASVVRKHLRMEEIYRWLNLGKGRG
jgi:adenosylcobyric acid synthase